VSADELLLHVEAHLLSVLGDAVGRASVTFHGTEQIDVLRFGPDEQGVTRYATVGMSRRPMTDPTAELLTETGPRAELVLSLADPRDDAFRALAVLAASPVVEGVVVAAGAGLSLGEPLWPGAGYDSVLVAEPGGLVPDLELDPQTVIHFLPLLPMTPAEAAWKRVHGATALQERWLARGTDLRDPRRPAVDLT
jgi:hypothetical protein